MARCIYYNKLYLNIYSFTIYVGLIGLKFPPLFDMKTLIFLLM
jgi:hypothetical protein